MSPPPDPDSATRLSSPKPNRNSQSRRPSNPQSAIRNPQSLKVCFVTGTRAEFGLMASTLRAIRSHPKLELQIVATGMHLDAARGNTVDGIRAGGWTVDRVVPWDAPAAPTPATTARSTGLAVAGIVDALEELRSDVVLVVGDRVEAFAAATAGHVSGRVVAHVHGGDRALGQVDDALRHAITKLAHVHFPATKQSADRIRKLGEDRWRIHRVGSPGIDGIAKEAASRRAVAAALGGPLEWGRYVLLVLHPASADDAVEYRRAMAIAGAAASLPASPRVVVVLPNNDPGSAGILKAWGTRRRPDDGRQFTVCPDLPRPVFLGLMRDAAVLLGNSSSGIIEAASFGTPVIDVGPRQRGREHGRNVTHVAYNSPAIRAALARVWNNGRPRRAIAANPYGGAGTGRRIAKTLAALTLNPRLMRKLIAY